MAQEFRLPRIGDSLAEATIDEWNVSVGDTITTDQVVCSVETSKTVVEVPCPHAGVVLFLGGEVGDMLELDDILIVVGEVGESWSPDAAEAHEQTAPEAPIQPPPAASDSVQIFRLPRVGDSMVEATLQSWLVGIGDKVEKDQVVCEAETSKIVVEVPCPYEGYVLYLGAEEGDVVELDAILIVVGEEGASWAPESAAQAPAKTAEADVAGTSVSAGRAVSGGGIKAMPKVRKLARELGVNLATVTVTGRDGVITATDVQAATGPAPAVKPAAERLPSMVSAGVSHERQRLSGLRKAIADNVARSWREIPHAAMEWQIDFTKVLEKRKQIIADTGVKVAVDALLISAVVPLLDEFPEFNACIDGDDLVLYQDVNVGIAVGSLEGLVVPVIRDAKRKTVQELTEDILRLSQAAMDRNLQPQDLGGLTFTISNVGATGAAWGGAAIIPGGTAGMLSAGKALPRPVVIDGEVQVRPIIQLAMTYDHRAFDGAHVAKFFNRLQVVLESGEF